MFEISIWLCAEEGDIDKTAEWTVFLILRILFGLSKELNETTSTVVPVNSVGREKSGGSYNVHYHRKVLRRDGKAAVFACI